MDFPKTKLKRAFTGGKTALEIGGNTLKYVIKKPFISSEKKEEHKLWNLKTKTAMYPGTYKKEILRSNR